MGSCTDPIGVTDMTTETLVWHIADRKPDRKQDAEITVLCWRQRTGDWYSGWWDGEHWYDTSNGERLRGVTHWAELAGPTK